VRNVRQAIPGDLVEVSLIGRPKTIYKVVQNWTMDEPRQLLVTLPEAMDAKCYVVLAEDCELVREWKENGY
jgi:hypothetical protein